MGTNNPEIDADRFGLYATKKGINIAKCPSCGLNDPALLVHDNGNVNTGLVYARGGEILPTALPLVVLECENCGHLWLYNRNSVLEKLGER